MFLSHTQSSKKNQLSKKKAQEESDRVTQQLLAGLDDSPPSTPSSKTDSPSPTSHPDRQPSHSTSPSTSPKRKSPSKATITPHSIRESQRSQNFMFSFDTSPTSQQGNTSDLHHSPPSHSHQNFHSRVYGHRLSHSTPYSRVPFVDLTGHIDNRYQVNVNIRLTKSALMINIIEPL